MKKLLALLAALAILAAACGSDASNTAPATPAAEAEDVPHRILSLSPTGTEMLFAIGAGDQVIAVDSFSYYPPEAPVTDLSAFEPNIEAIAEFEPDLVVFDFDPGDLASGLETLGIATIGVPAAATFDDIYAEIAALGEATGNVAGADELIASMRKRIKTAVFAHQRSSTPLTYYHEIDTTYFSLTSSTFAGQIYELFGLVNIADAQDADGSAFGYPQLSEEYIIDQDPDLIFLADVLYEGQTLDAVAARPGWDTMTAVQNGNVVELNDDIVSRWGPRVVEYVEAIDDALLALSAQG